MVARTEGPSHGLAGSVLPGTVVYDRTTAEDVHSIFRLQGGIEQRLTDPGAYQLGRLSPDRTVMTVMPGGDLAPPITGGTLRIDGTGYVAFSLHDATLNLIPGAWSPDGKRFALLGWDDADPSRTGIYTARVADGQDLVRVTTRPGPLADVPLDYSPDGQWILFYRSAHPDPDPHTGGVLWVVRIDGTDAHLISGDAHPADWARWSPDGREILFASERLSSEGAIWAISFDTLERRKVFADPAGGFPITPTWARDGSRILFAVDPTNDEFTHPPNSFVVIAADGSGAEAVAGTTGFSRWPEWWQ
jgi:Tol biopolymer transport system component